METLKRVHKSKNAKDDLIDLFPLPRYFQAHFQHIHENTHDFHGELIQLKDYVAKVDEKLERLMPLPSLPQTWALIKR